MSGFRELFQSAVQRHDRRGRRADVDDAGPLFAIRVRPIREARARWANVAGSRLGYDGAGNRVEFVTEPKTGLKLPGTRTRRPSHGRAPRTPTPSSTRPTLEPRTMHPSPMHQSRSCPLPPLSSLTHPSPTHIPRPTPRRQYCVRGKTSVCPLTGMGVRVKRIAGVGVKVCACGLCVDPRRSPPSATRRRTQSVGRGEGPIAVRHVAEHAKVEKTARLVFARDLDSAKVSDALSERLRPALGAGSASLRAFESHFEGVQFEGAVADVLGGGRRAAHVHSGKEVGAIADPELCVALFDAYLGKDPVVPGSQSLGEQLAVTSRGEIGASASVVGCERWEGGGRDETPSTVCNASDVSTRRTTVCRRRRGADDVLGRVEGEGAFGLGRRSFL